MGMRRYCMTISDRRAEYFRIALRRNIAFPPFLPLPQPLPFALASIFEGEADAEARSGCLASEGVELDGEPVERLRVRAAASFRFPSWEQTLWIRVGFG